MVELLGPRPFKEKTTYEQMIADMKQLDEKRAQRESSKAATESKLESEDTASSEEQATSNNPLDPTSTTQDPPSSQNVLPPFQFCVLYRA